MPIKISKLSDRDINSLLHGDRGTYGNFGDHTDLANEPNSPVDIFAGQQK